MLRSYVEESSSVAMMVTRRSAGVTLEVNLREHVAYICLCKVQIRLPTLALKSTGDITRSPKQGYQWLNKKDLCPPKMLKNTKFINGFYYYRYICIVFPMFHKTRLTHSHAAIMIAIAWLIGPCYNAVMVGPTSDAGEDGYCLYIRVSYLYIRVSYL